LAKGKILLYFVNFVLQSMSKFLLRSTNDTTQSNSVALLIYTIVYNRKIFGSPINTFILTAKSWAS